MNTFSIVFLFFLQSFSILCSAFPQSNKWREVQYTYEVGLSGNRIETLVQDSLGYMWIGTINGLNRFDGLKNKIYETSALDTNTIPDNSIYQFLIDTKGQLLIVTSKGLCVYNRLKDNFIRINATKWITTKCIIEDIHGDYWIGTLGKGHY